MVVAVLLILPGSSAPGRALLAVLLHWLPLRLHGPSTHLVVLLVLPVAALVVVIPIMPRQVLVVVLLLILIPASATTRGSWIAASLPVATLVVVASATLVSALSPAVSRLVVLVSLRVLS